MLCFSLTFWTASPWFSIRAQLFREMSFFSLNLPPAFPGYLREPRFIKRSYQASCKLLASYIRDPSRASKMRIRRYKGHSDLEISCCGRRPRRLSGGWLHQAQCRQLCSVKRERSGRNRLAAGIHTLQGEGVEYRSYLIVYSSTVLCATRCGRQGQ